jgi:predicted transcriptional regulator of viral defense system
LETIVNEQTLADHLGIKKPTVRALVLKGVFERVDRGCYSLEKSEQAYIVHKNNALRYQFRNAQARVNIHTELNGAKVNVQEDLSSITIDESRRRESVAKMQLLELKVNEEKKNLVRYDSVIEKLRSPLVNFKNKLESIGPRVAPLCVGRSAPEINEIWQTEVRDALEELSAMELV